MEINRMADELNKLDFKSSDIGRNIESEILESIKTKKFAAASIGGRNIESELNTEIRKITPERLTAGMFGKNIEKEILYLAKVSKVFGQVGIATNVLSFLLRKIIGINARAAKKTMAQIAKNKIRNHLQRRILKTAGEGIRNLGGIHANVAAGIGGAVRPNISVDTSEFDAAMKEYVKYSKRSAEEIVNNKALAIAIGSYKNTYSAEKSVIRNYLSQPSNISPTLRIADVLAMRGKSNFNKKDIGRMGNALIKKRMAHTGSLKRSWLQALRDLSKVIKTKSFINRGLPYGSGTGSPSRGQKPIASAEFTSILSVKSGQSKVDRYLQSANQLAFAKEAQSMREYVQRKVDQQNKAFSSK
jgi:hypothetical protein